METINDLFGPIAANDNKRTCPECGAPVEGHVTKVYCCKACRVRAKGLRQRPSRDAVRAAKSPTKQCLDCGKDFKAINKGNEPLFCSKSCSTGYRSRAKALDDLVAAMLNGTKLTTVSYTVHKKRCVTCNAWHTNRGALCSEECIAAYNRFMAREHNIKATMHKRVDRECKECGVMFSPEYGAKIRTYCSSACSKRHSGRIAKSIRDARIKTTRREPVSHTKVFKQANWMCAVCGVDTPREMRGSNDNSAPELDHIVPLSRGGTHTYDNVQCLCRKCNGEKSDMLMDEWLASA